MLLIVTVSLAYVSTKYTHQLFWGEGSHIKEPKKNLHRSLCAARQVSSEVDEVLFRAQHSSELAKNDVDQLASIWYLEYL